MNAEIVKNLGLRPNPPTVCTTLSSQCPRLTPSSEKKVYCSELKTAPSTHLQLPKVSAFSQIIHSQRFPPHSTPIPSSFPSLPLQAGMDTKDRIHHKSTSHPNLNTFLPLHLQASTDIMDPTLHSNCSRSSPKTLPKLITPTSQPQQQIPTSVKLCNLFSPTTLVCRALQHDLP